jgi:hypothetical protein
MKKKGSYIASKGALTLYGGLFKSVVQEVGLDKALAMHASLWSSMGTTSAGMLREKLGRKKVNLAAWQSIEAKFCDDFGIASEFKKRGSTLSVQTVDCPIYEGWKSAGLDHNTIELMCNKMAGAIYEELKKEFPQLSGCLKFRATPDEACVEEFVLLK